jgi:hypothetical protein
MASIFWSIPFLTPNACVEQNAQSPSCPDVQEQERRQSGRMILQISLTLADSASLLIATMYRPRRTGCPILYYKILTGGFRTGLV